jgi:hypothetical protein
MKMSPLLTPASRVSTVSGGDAVPVTLTPLVPTGLREHAETHAAARAQAAPVTRTVVSRGRDGRLPVAQSPRLTRRRDVIMNLRKT